MTPIYAITSWGFQVYGNFRNAFHQVGQSATYVEALNTARAAAVQIYKVESNSIWYKKV